MSSQFVQFVFRNSKWIAGTIFVITILLAVVCVKTPFNGDPLHAFVNDPKVIEEHLNQSRKYGDDLGKTLILLADDGDNLFTAKHLSALRSALKQILAIEEVKSATSFIDACRKKQRGQSSIKTATQKSVLRSHLLRGTVPDKEVKLDRYWPSSRRKRARADMSDLREEALADKSLTGKLLATDGKKHSIIVTIDPAEELSLPRQMSLCDEIRGILIDHRVGQNGLYLAGLPAAHAAIGEQIQLAFMVLLPLGFCAVAALVFFIYRDFRVTMLIVLIGGIAVIWAIGLTSLVFGEITLLIAATPLIVLSVSTTDFLHITTAYQIKHADSELGTEQSLSTVMQEVGGACVLTSVTTFIGFASLVLTRSAAVREFGFACAIGTSVALLLMVTLLPIGFRKMKPLSSVVKDNIIYRIVDWILAISQSIGKKIPLAIFVATISVCIPGIWIISGKPIDANLAGRFPSSHSLRQSVEVLEEEFMGVTSIELYVSANSKDLLSHAATSKLKEFRHELAARPSVLGMISILDFFDGIEDLISYRTVDGLPPEAKVAEASLQWVAKNEPGLVDSLITQEKDQTRIKVMTRLAGVRKTNQTAIDLEQALQKKLGSNFEVSSGGTYSLIGNATNGNVRSQIFGFFICIISLTAIMAWGLGGWRVAILAQIPNLIPVLLMVSVVALTLNRIDVDLLGLPMIALGIAVDDTIHFLNRYRLAISRGDDSETALAVVFQTTGRSIVISTMVLCAGMLPLAFAQIISLWMLGTFLVVGILGALIADLLCLPAMIRLEMIR